MRKVGCASIPLGWSIFMAMVTTLNARYWRKFHACRTIYEMIGIGEILANKIRKIIQDRESIIYYYYYYYYSHIFPDFRAQHCNYATLLAGKVLSEIAAELELGYAI